MSWADKQLRKQKVHKLVENAMRDPRYVEVQKDGIYQGTAGLF